MGALTVPAFATNDVAAAGGTGTVPVELTAEAATFSVTVPTSLAISVDASGVVTTPTVAKIVNNSHGAVKVTGVSVAAQNGWATVDFVGADMTKEKVGAKKIALEVNNEKTTGANTISFSAENWTKLDGKNETTSDELAIIYKAKVPAQASPLEGTTVANVVFTIGWDAVV